MNGDGAVSDLIYIPNHKGEIRFRDVAGKMTADQQAEKFMEYVLNDNYLSKHQGEYAGRFGKVNPWRNRWDVKVLQDVFADFGTDKRYTLQVSLDIVNAANLLSKNWGLYKKSGLANNYDVIMPLKYMGRSATGEPEFTLNATDIANFDAKNQLINQLTTGSTWGMQLGVRLVF